MSLLVFGSTNADLVFRVRELPRPGETVLGEGGDALPGGKGLNQAIAAARDGAAVRFAGMVGADGFGHMLRRTLADAGVETAMLGEGPAPTGLASICVDAAGENQIVVAPGANALARAAAVPDTALEAGSVLLAQMELPPPEVFVLIARARRRGLRCVLNLAPATPLPEGLLGPADWLVLNEGEMRALTEGGASALTCGMLVTRGAKGVQGPGFDLPAIPVAVRDTTGAGDAFCGVFAAGLARGLVPEQAARRAVAAAALACTKDGAAGAMPTAADTDRLLAAT